MSRITAYAALASLQGDDVLPVVDVHDTSMAASGTTKKVSVSSLANFTNGQIFSPLQFNSASGDGSTLADSAIAAAIAAIPLAGGILDLSGASVSYAVSQPIVLKSGASVIGTFINNQDNPAGANKTDITCLSSFAGAAVMGDAGALATGFSATVSSATISGQAASALFTATGSTFANNAAVRVGATSMPGNFTQDTTYFVIPVGSGTFGLSAASGPGTPVLFSTAGTAVTAIASFGASLPVSIRGVSIDMTNVPSGQAPDGILLMTFRSIVEENFIRGSVHSGNGIRVTDRNLGNAVLSGSANEQAIRNNWIVAMGGTGILAERTTATAKLTDGYVIGNLVEQHAVNQGDAYDSTGPGIDIEPGADWQVHGNHVYRCPADGIVVNHAFTCFVTNNKVDNFGLAGAASTTYHGIWVNNANGPATVVANNEVDGDEQHGLSTTNYHYYEMAAANTLPGVITMTGNSARKDFDNPNAGGSVVLTASGTGSGGSLGLIDVGMTSVATSGTAPTMAVTKTGTVNLRRGPLPAKVAFAPSNPTATTSQTPTFVMAGIGSTVTYTPSLTGNVLVRISGTAGTATAVQTVSLRGRYGTGTAPANAAAETGTQFSPASGSFALRSQAITTTGLAMFYLEGIITGLTLGTAYWFDIGFNTGATADAAAVANITAVVEEIS